jgi:hypothetical protein
MQGFSEALMVFAEINMDTDTMMICGPGWTETIDIGHISVLDDRYFNRVCVMLWDRGWEQGSWAPTPQGYRTELRKRVFGGEHT